MFSKTQTGTNNFPAVDSIWSLKNKNVITMKNLLLLLLLLILQPVLNAQERTAAFDMNKRLGRGINMGNAFEAPTETLWGNPWKPEYFRIMSELGFSHVRVPIRWEPADRSMSTAPFTIYPAFLNRIKQVVDTALKYKLHVIINMHHHEALIANPAGQKARFLSQWNQIGQFFKSYSDSLLFEVLNEPNGNLTAEMWNQYFAEALAEIRKTNPERFVLIGTADWGGLGGLAKLQVPADENLILSVHYYNPFQFTHQGAEWSGEQSQAWLGTKWLDSEAERDVIHNEFKAAKDFSSTRKIPVHIGEFGAYSKADITSRVRWTTYLSRWFETQEFSWAYWEFSAGFGIYNPSTKQLLTPLANALLKNEIPAPARVETTPVYTSNFTSGNDGWSLQVNTSGGAVASMVRSAGKLNINITNGGTQGWHIQLIKGNVALQAGKTYRVSYRVSAPATRSFTAYVGKASSPWNAYSGYNSASVGTAEEKVTYIFTMPETDSNARMVFDLGNVGTGITIFDIRIESVVITPTSASLISNPGFSYFPNPVNDILNIDNTGNWDLAELYNLGGSLLSRHTMNIGLNQIDTSYLKPGIYLVRLSGPEGTNSVKIQRK
jgi:endoglucanase